MANEILKEVMNGYVDRAVNELANAEFLVKDKDLILKETYPTKTLNYGGIGSIEKVLDGIFNKALESGAIDKIKKDLDVKDLELIIVTDKKTNIPIIIKDDDKFIEVLGIYEFKADVEKEEITLVRFMDYGEIIKRDLKVSMNTGEESKNDVLDLVVCPMDEDIVMTIGVTQNSVSCTKKLSIMLLRKGVLI